ncbi:50S ribosomal protein L5 [candidate division WWE3 bacterium CG08_land_8_20_14_0_20_40_13]|uniref:Large ribosomal subunit protein uL5 n=1 Tax=candidate division WWE3 bacterium CG08_land_8_20_14_0_20_40_13 TaxID=1975084 RepID=A0A2H0XES0_UNCKA|nr:MAG: 50S ribosomal protein L5 [candidate division WWE3 bacterium CG08_land_8_20_14_0_20_40_13]
MNSLLERYHKEIREKLQKEMGVKNILAVPEIKKITVNMGVGRFKGEKAYREQAMMDLTNITGQKPNWRQSKKAISSFKLRKGEDVGLAATLRGARMWDFMQNLVMVVLPRIRDFRGLSPDSFDGSGNYSIGIREHTVFPTVDTGEVDKIKSLQVTICTTAKDDKKAHLLLKSLGVPFNKRKEELKEKK